MIRRGHIPGRIPVENEVEVLSHERWKLATAARNWHMQCDKILSLQTPFTMFLCTDAIPDQDRGRNQSASSALLGTASKLSGCDASSLAPNQVKKWPDHYFSRQNLIEDYFEETISTVHWLLECKQTHTTHLHSETNPPGLKMFPSIYHVPRDLLWGFRFVRWRGKLGGGL